ncbi:TPA: hypothetical protein ACX3GY_000644 [Vibrio parahaemolyticus]
MSEVCFNYDILEHERKYNDISYLILIRKGILDQVQHITDRKISYCQEIIDNKKSVDFSVFQKKMASFGGQISGQSRKFKQELIEYIANSLFDQNHEELNCLSVRELRLFFKLTFGNAPSQTFFIRHNGRKASKEFYNLSDFKKYILSKKLKRNRNDSILKLFIWYEKEYKNFQNDIKRIKSEGDQKMKLAKKLVKKDIEKE